LIGYNIGRWANILARGIIKKMKKTIFATNSQKILEFLIQAPGEEYLSREIQIAVKISKAGTNFALNDLVSAGFARRKKRGKMYLYAVNYGHPIIKQLKILKVIMFLDPLLKKIRNKSQKIILYGSSSRGENTKDSDIDLFVVTNSLQEVEKIVRNSSKGKIIQLIVRTPLKYIEMEKTDPIFYAEIERGIVLWEVKDES
jgi:predicted nucleotidyltransferase